MRNPEYYALGHASRFVAQGAQRIASTSRAQGIDTVAFVNPDGTRVLIAFNAGAAPAPATIESEGRRFAYTIAPQAAVTFRWHGVR